MRLSAAILCAFLSFSFIAAPSVEAAQKKPATVKVVKKKAAKKTLVKKSTKKVVAASAKKKAKASTAKAAGKRVAVKNVVRNALPPALQAVNLRLQRTIVREKQLTGQLTAAEVLPTHSLSD